MYTEILDKYEIAQTQQFTLSILTYEIGTLFKLEVYQERFGKVGLIGDFRIELSDAITQACLLVEQTDQDLQQLLRWSNAELDSEQFWYKTKSLSNLIISLGNLHASIKIVPLIELLAGLKYVCVSKSLDFDELQKEGLERFDYRISEVKKAQDG